MRIEMCEIDASEDIGSGDESVRTKLNSVLRCKAPFHIHVDKAAELVRTHRELIDNPHANFQLLDTLIEHIESKIFFASNAERLMLELRRDRGDLKLLNEAYCAWETTLEKIFSRRLCNGAASSLHDYRLNNRFQRLLKRETSMLRSSSPKRALFVGSGPFPISAIWLHRILGIPVDGLDVSEDAIIVSRELIGKLGLGDSIRVIHQDSASYDVGAYDVIVIALLAKPKVAILENIHKSAKDDCEIICRTSFGPRTVIYEPTIMSDEMISKFTIEDAWIVEGHSDDTISSLLLRKSL